MGEGGPSSEKCGVLITTEFLPLMKEMSPLSEKVQNGVLTRVEKNKLLRLNRIRYYFEYLL